MPASSSEENLGVAFTPLSPRAASEDEYTTRAPRASLCAESRPSNSAACPVVFIAMMVVMP
eukprot:3579454-Prymnesium_polylepis.1